MIRPIFLYSSQILTEKTTPFSLDSEDTILQDIQDTILTIPCIGLSANQIGSHNRVIAIRDMDDQSKCTVYVNPEIVQSSEETSYEYEYCLSIPGVAVQVQRPTEIHLRWQTTDGSSMEGTFSGIYARAIQHEIDHLNGKLITDYLTPSQLQSKKSKLKKIIRKNINLNYGNIIYSGDFKRLLDQVARVEELMGKKPTFEVQNPYEEGNITGSFQEANTVSQNRPY